MNGNSNVGGKLIQRFIRYIMVVELQSLVIISSTSFAIVFIYVSFRQSSLSFTVTAGRESKAVYEIT